MSRFLGKISRNVTRHVLSLRSHGCGCGPVSQSAVWFPGIWKSSNQLSTHVNLKSCDKPSYFITTPIFYVNAVPHIGHLYTTVLTDVLSRWHRIKGYDVIFSTGTDEHGLKVILPAGSDIQQVTEKHSRDPQTYCNEVSLKFKELFDMADIDYTDWIRTTESRHRESVHHFWKCLEERGYIYQGSYEGWYCTSDEAFLTDDQVTEVKGQDGKTTKVSVESGNPVEWTTETNYMFRLSEFKKPLTEWLDKKVIKPEVFEPLVRGWVADLVDLSVSRERSRLHWGITVPGDPSQTIYVWLDALVNYLTVGGYPASRYRWPADCHVVGKDILRFHAVYWPAFLMAAGLDPPRSILCHSHWTMDNQKMSKSKGNVVDPVDRLGHYGVDGLRYFLMREGVPHSDGNYTDQRVLECINSELVNTLGNLLNRCTAKSLNPNQIFPPVNMDVFHQRCIDGDQDMLQNLFSLPAQVDEHFSSYQVYKGLEAIMKQLRWTNNFVQAHTPWELNKSKEQTDKIWMHCIMGITMETLRVCGTLLQPVVPSISDKLLTRLGVTKSDRCLESVRSLNKDIICTRPESRLGTIEGVLYPRIKS